MQTPRQLRAEAARLRARAAELEQAADDFESIERRLTSTRVDTNLDQHMDATRTKTTAQRYAVSAKNADPARVDSLFGAWLKDREMAASVWADGHRGTDGSLRWSPNAVRAWMLPRGAVGARACPEDAATVIADETGGAVPAVDASWPSGISRPRRRAV